MCTFFIKKRICALRGVAFYPRVLMLILANPAATQNLHLNLLCIVFAFFVHFRGFFEIVKKIRAISPPKFPKNPKIRVTPPPLEKTPKHGQFPPKHRVHHKNWLLGNAFSLMFFW